MFSKDRKPKIRLLITSFLKFKKILDEVMEETKEIGYVRVEPTIEYLESLVKLSKRKKEHRQSIPSVTKREGRELKRELCRNTETTRHGEHTDPNRI